MYRPSARVGGALGGGSGAGIGGGTGGFKPKRYATKLNPPTFILEYGDESLGLLRTRKFRLKKIATEKNLERTADEIIRTFPSRVNRSFVSKQQILKLLEGLKEKIASRNQALLTQVDLNKYGTEELNQVKEQMEHDFLKNAKKPGDEGYKYDVQVDFGHPTEDNDWDSTDEEEQEVEEDIDLPLP